MDYFSNDLKKNNHLIFENTNSVVTKFIRESAENNSQQKIENFSSKIDFEMPYRWAKLSFSGKTSFTKTNNEVRFLKYDITKGTKTLELTQSDIFEYKENTQSLYFSANRKFGDKWKGKIGLRAEITQNKGNSESTNKINKKHYLKFFPTFYLSYKANEDNTFSLSYGRRINRSSYSQIKPSSLVFNC